MLERRRVIDLYGPLLAKALFPAFEAARGRPTVPLLQYLHTTERWSIDALRDLQLGLLRRLLRHAYQHTAHYRQVMDDAELRPEDLESVADLARLPLLDKETVRATMHERTAGAPPHATITKSTSGTTGEPVVVKYNTESRYWRDATRWRGYGWGGYRIGMRAFHYWGAGPAPTSWLKRRKVAIDHALKRDLYVDSTPRGEAALAHAVGELRRFQPGVIVAYSAERPRSRASSTRNTCATGGAPPCSSARSGCGRRIARRSSRLSGRRSRPTARAR